eukprot:TRINITY_DN15805_c0_g1_i2.p1 TRINITY_DN15805_c0_g1~~TRINITY_DN15805_c0_g1_i2.p1  ORF type:complete len:850 (+),score=233.60 TRINITY_DN15805_c0_g1_i2:84-2633(+)
MEPEAAEDTPEAARPPSAEPLPIRRGSSLGSATAATAPAEDVVSVGTPSAVSSRRSSLVMRSQQRRLSGAAPKAAVEELQGKLAAANAELEELRAQGAPPSRADEGREVERLRGILQEYTAVAEQAARTSLLREEDDAFLCVYECLQTARKADVDVADARLENARLSELLEAARARESDARWEARRVDLALADAVGSLKAAELCGSRQEGTQARLERDAAKAAADAAQRVRTAEMAAERAKGEAARVTEERRAVVAERDRLMAEKEAWVAAQEYAFETEQASERFRTQYNALSQEVSRLQEEASVLVKARDAAAAKAAAVETAAAEKIDAQKQLIHSLRDDAALLEARLREATTDTEVKLQHEMESMLTMHASAMQRDELLLSLKADNAALKAQTDALQRDKDRLLAKLVREREATANAPALTIDRSLSGWGTHPQPQSQSQGGAGDDKAECRTPLASLCTSNPGGELDATLTGTLRERLASSRLSAAVAQRSYASAEEAVPTLDSVLIRSVNPPPAAQPVAASAPNPWAALLPLLSEALDMSTEVTLDVLKARVLKYTADVQALAHAAEVKREAAARLKAVLEARLKAEIVSLYDAVPSAQVTPVAATTPSPSEGDASTQRPAQAAMPPPAGDGDAHPTTSQRPARAAGIAASLAVPVGTLMPTAAVPPAAATSGIAASLAVPVPAAPAIAVSPTPATPAPARRSVPPYKTPPSSAAPAALPAGSPVASPPHVEPPPPQPVVMYTHVHHAAAPEPWQSRPPTPQDLSRVYRRAEDDLHSLRRKVADLRVLHERINAPPQPMPPRTPDRASHQPSFPRSPSHPPPPDGGFASTAIVTRLLANSVVGRSE